MMYGFSLTMQ